MRRGRGLRRATPTQGARKSQIAGNLGRAVHLGYHLSEEPRVKETRRYTRRGHEGALLGLRNRESCVSQQALPPLGANESRACSRRTSMTRQRSRDRGKGRVEQGRIRRLEPILFQHREDARHQPEGRRRHIQLIQKQPLKALPCR